MSLTVLSCDNEDYINIVASKLEVKNISKIALLNFEFKCLYSKIHFFAIVLSLASQVLFLNEVDANDSLQPRQKYTRTAIRTPSNLSLEVDNLRENSPSISSWHLQLLEAPSA